MYTLTACLFKLNWPNMRSSEDFSLKFFRKSVRTISVGWQSKIFKEGISCGFAFATCTWNVSSVMCPLHQSLVWGITQVRGLHMKYCKRGEEKLIAGQQFPSFRTCNSSKLTVRLTRANCECLRRFWGASAQLGIIKSFSALLWTYVALCNWLGGRWIIRRNQILAWVCKWWFGVTKGPRLKILPVNKFWIVNERDLNF